jgi:tetratricopeptide (TPR) repeat protein
MVEDDGKGPVERGAHFYRSFLLDERGNHINKRNAWAGRSVLYVRMIPPGAADTAHYRLKIPEDAGSRLKLTARLNYRKFSWWNTQWAYAGVRDPAQTLVAFAKGYDNGRWLFTGDTSNASGLIKEIPNLPIVVMASDTAELRVLDKRQSIPEPKLAESKEVRERWNDYGIGLLLQGDLRGAEAVFLKVTRMDPAYADGFVNVARCRIQIGDNPGAQEMLRRALELDPTLAKSHYFYGQTLKVLGQYDESLKHLRSAEAQFPRDRAVLNEIGRVLLLQRRYGDSIDALRRVLQVDPEDLQAHYNLMLAYRGAGKTVEAQREQALYERFKADEASQAITGDYRRQNPEDNNERQRIHEHGTAVRRSYAPARVATGND